jgi:hypothetical protein
MVFTRVVSHRFLTGSGTDILIGGLGDSDVRTNDIQTG